MARSGLSGGGAVARLSLPNLAFDPNFRYFDPTTASQNGRDRWYYDSGALTRISPDTNNPFGLPTVRLSGGGTVRGGRRLWRTEMGVRTGERMSFAIYCLIPSTRTVRIALAWRQSNDSVITTTTGTATAGTDAAAWLSLENQAVPANTAYVDVYVLSVSGTGDVDLYEIRAVRGGTALLPTADTHAGMSAWAAVQGALGGSSTLNARIAAIESDVSGLEIGAWSGTEAAYGRCFLRDWGAALSNVQSADGTSQAVIALIGDSWVNTDKRYTHALRTKLWSEYGNAGIGYVSAAPTHLVPTSVTRTVDGTWTEHTRATSPAGLGVDLFDMTSSDTSTPASIAWEYTASAFVLYYLKTSGGGEFRYRVDSGSWTTVDTDAAEALASVEISGLDGNSHTLEVEVVSAGSAGVTLFGVDIQRTGNGVRVHKLGATGSTASNWASHPDPDLWAAQVEALAPNVVILTLGTNDDNADVTPANYRTHLETIIGRIRAVLPLVDILILTPSANGLTAGTYTMDDYIAEVRALCVEESYAGYDAYLQLGSYADADARGEMQDTAHINEKGGRAIIRQMLYALLWVP